MPEYETDSAAMVAAALDRVDAVLREEGVPESLRQRARAKSRPRLRVSEDGDVEVHFATDDAWVPGRGALRRLTDEMLESVPQEFRKPGDDREALTHRVVQQKRASGEYNL